MFDDIPYKLLEIKRFGLQDQGAAFEQGRVAQFVDAGAAAAGTSNVSQPKSTTSNHLVRLSIDTLLSLSCRR
jgi:hypothetical protein